MTEVLTEDDIKQLPKSQGEIRFILAMLRQAPYVTVIRDDKGEVYFRGIKLKSKPG